MMKKKISVLAVVLCILAGIFFITEDTFAAGTKVYETDIFFRENGSDVSVSYTHLDVYKRQLYGYGTASLYLPHITAGFRLTLLSIG